MDHYMIRQELNPETCRLVTKHTKKKTWWSLPKSQTQEWLSFLFPMGQTHEWPKFILVPKSQTQEWPRVHFGSKEPDTRMALFPMGQTQEWPRFTLVPKSQTQEWLNIYIYIYICIVASKLRTPAPMDSKAGTFSVPDTRLFVGHSLVTGRVAPCLRIKFLKLGWRRERTEGKKREVLHLCRCYTHTHTRACWWWLHMITIYDYI